MDPNDLKRYFEKWKETLDFAYEYFTKQSESYAAQHINKKVMYSPICNRISEMIDDIRIVENSIG
jgi:hypothetical protein